MTIKCAQSQSLGNCVEELVYYRTENGHFQYEVRCKRHFQNGVYFSLLKKVTREEYEAYAVMEE